MDELTFFRNATTLICANLDIEIATFHCFQFIREVIPASLMHLSIYEQDTGSVRNLSMVTNNGIQKPFSARPIPEGIRAPFESLIEEGGHLLILNHPDLDQIPKTLYPVTGKPDRSLLALILSVSGSEVHFLALSTNGRGKYTQSHARLLSLLREPLAIAMSNGLKHQEILKLKEILDAENRELSRELLCLSGDEIIGSNTGLRGVMEMVRRVGHADSPVMLLGETGVGKELIANAIHYSSSRKNGSLIKVNCGAIPDTLIDSELFGHERGSFTGAVDQKRGRFERAHKGSLFLDEIGDLPLKAQVRLLRVIQNKEIERVGGTKSIPVDVRIIAATHESLEEKIATGEFREDLWFRLNVFPITVPPLRTRREDIPELVYHFLEKKSRELKVQNTPAITPEIMGQLKSYNWPGNVRELENMIERALILARGRNGISRLDSDHFIFREEKYALEDPSTQRLLSLDEAISSCIQRALHWTRGKIYGKDGAAQVLKVNPNTLRSKMKKLKIASGRFK